jgi:sensor histidine kinase regulating citrate/malate metabolism
MKRVNGLLIAAIMLLVAGCGLSSEQRIAMYKQAVDQAVEAGKQLDSYIPAIDEAIAQSESAIQAGLPEDQAAKLLDKIAKAKEVKAKVLEQKAAIDKAAAQAQAKIDEIIAGGGTDIDAELQSISAILTAAGAAIPPPASGLGRSVQSGPHI